MNALKAVVAFMVILVWKNIIVLIGVIGLQSPQLMAGEDFDRYIYVYICIYIYIYLYI
jgi:hypothetical protein